MKTEEKFASVRVITLLSACAWVGVVEKEENMSPFDRLKSDRIIIVMFTKLDLRCRAFMVTDYWILMIGGLCCLLSACFEWMSVFCNLVVWTVVFDKCISIIALLRAISFRLSAQSECYEVSFPLEQSYSCKMYHSNAVSRSNHKLRYISLIDKDECDLRYTGLPLWLAFSSRKSATRVTNSRSESPKPIKII